MIEARVTVDSVYCGICARRLAGREEVLRRGVLMEIICFDRVHWRPPKGAAGWTYGRHRPVAGIHRTHPKPENAPPWPGQRIWHDDRAWWHVAMPAKLACPCGAEQVAQPLAR